MSGRTRGFGATAGSEQHDRSGYHFHDHSVDRKRSPVNCPGNGAQGGGAGQQTRRVLDMPRDVAGIVDNGIPLPALERAKAVVAIALVEREIGKELVVGATACIEV